MGGIVEAPSFDTAEDADDLVREAAGLHRAAGEAWGENDVSHLRIDAVLSRRTGLCVSRTGVATDVTGVRAVFTKDPSTRQGFTLVTAYPTRAEWTGQHATVWPALWHLFGAHLHQDCIEEYGSAEAALDDFLAGGGHFVASLPGEIDDFRADSDEQEVIQSLLTLGIGYLPTADDGSVTTWFVQARDRVARHLAGDGHPA